MSLVSLSNEYHLTSYTLVDNVFLHEFMPECPDRFLKVYLYGLYAVSVPALNTLEQFCRALKLSEEEVAEAFSYFEEYGLCSLLSRNPLAVTFHPLSGMLSKPRKIKPQKYAEFTKQVQALLPDRMISTAEFSEYFNLIEVYKLQPEALILIIKYCTLLKDRSVSYKYILAVAKNWAARGILTLDACEKELAAFDRQSQALAEVFKAMGLRAKPDFHDSELYAKWTEEYGFGQEAILFAAGRLKGNRPNMTKLDGMLSDYYRFRKFSPAEMAEHDRRRTGQRELALTLCRRLGEYVPDLSPVIEHYVSPWTDQGFDEKTLETVADYCFQSGIRTLEGMKNLLEKFKKLGLLSLDSITAFLDEQAERERFLKEVLEAAGMLREVNSYDRSNYRLWSLEWGLPDEVILAAARRSKGLSPVRTMHRLLSACKAQNIRTAAGVEALSPEPAPPKKREEGVGHAYSKDELTAIFDDIQKSELF